jgi:hypothetical protein
MATIILVVAMNMASVLLRIKKKKKYFHMKHYLIKIELLYLINKIEPVILFIYYGDYVFTIKNQTIEIFKDCVFKTFAILLL